MLKYRKQDLNCVETKIKIGGDNMKLDREILKEIKRHKSDIREDLFIEPEGIHGIDHAARVMYLALTISKLENYNERDRNLLITASKFHDIGRINNNVCLIHGKLSNIKMDEHHLINNFSDEDKNILKYIVHNHCRHDEDTLDNIDAFHIEDKERAVRLLMAFKDSDGLDRVRVNDLDPNYLRNDSSKKLVTLAENLFKNELIV